jgi:hypothetical protein
LLEDRQTAVLLAKKIQQLIIHQQNKCEVVKITMIICQGFQKIVDGLHYPILHQHWIIVKNAGDQLQLFIKISSNYLWQHLSSIKIDGQLHKDLAEIGGIIKKFF